MSITCRSSLGPLTLVGGPDGLAALRFAGSPGAGSDHRGGCDGCDGELLAAAAGQLAEYLAGERTVFDLPLHLAGTPFQHRVWEELTALPYGTTVSYSDLARRVGRPGSARAVAAAVARTPVPIVIPCHRVIGSDGRLTGYIGGLERKRALLGLEAAVDRGGRAGRLRAVTPVPTA